MANSIKKAVFNLIDKAFTTVGVVSGIRKWKPESMYEIDLHLPETDMSKWITIPRLKCKVRDFEYRDYTPAAWDTEQRTCTLFVETGHEGFGSSWAQGLQVGDTILYGAAHAAALPAKQGKILGLGDGSALGHFLALKKLTGAAFPLEVSVCLNERYALPEALTAANPEFKFMVQPDASSIDILNQASGERSLKDFTSIYIAGYIPMVQGMRKILKKNPYLKAKIFAHGFWS